MLGKIKYILPVFFCISLTAQSQVTFEKFFTEKTLRYDFLLGGDFKTTEVYPQQIKKEPFWAGSKNGLIDPFDYGSYRIRVFDLESNELIFSKGFCPLFMEWQTTTEAKNRKRTFYQSAMFPFPKKKVKLEIDQRKWEGNFATIYNEEIDPTDYYIIEEIPHDYKTKTLVHSGKPEKCIDVVFLAEGYTEAEMEEFMDDAHRMTNYLFETSPFNKYKQAFNVTAVLTPSEDSGTDVPGEGIYKNTAFNSTFFTFGTPRYLTTSDLKNIYDAAACVPYDHIFVLVNTERYGGGGFYNFIGVGSADHELSEKVFVHEFGHQFAGLADEYYDSDVAFENFYNLKVEPWEANITTLVDFKNKWQELLDRNTPVPTPRETKYSKIPGVYEGGGYTSKGVFSPMMNCRMKSNEVPYFCPVCSATIEKIIEASTK